MQLKSETNLAKQLIIQEIQRRGGMDFSTFVDLALYHPIHGYYNQSSNRRGRSGDYFTSMQVSSLFPEIFAEALLQMKETLGAEQFSLIEVGSGNGEFLEAVLNAINKKREQTHSRVSGFRVWAVERSRPARDLLYKRLSRFPRCQVVASLDDIEWMGTLEGCIFSNEFFDALPFHRRRWRTDAWKEIQVTVDGGELVEVEKELKDENGKWKIENGGLEGGHEIEWRPQIPDIYKEWSTYLARGYVLTVDYGHPRASFLSPTRSNGTWMCYYRHKSNKEWAQNIGEQDITAHVDFTQLVEAGKKVGMDPALFCSQGIFLSYVGKKRIEEFLSQSPEAERRQRAAALQQLVHPDAMGETFWVLLQTKGVELPVAFGAIPNRLPRLV